MIKKITFAILIACLIVSCGKKGDPVYKESKKKTDTLIILTDKA
tara:strand:+ start:262 stop:393 length:132 start_codon:yes stop_codon:yes gene_type:complete